MEPVPETERMEEFRSSALPSLRVQGSPTLAPSDLDYPRKPPTLRRSTDPSPTSSPTSPSWAPPAMLPYRPRASSPLSSAHTRSRSAVSLAPPPMTRTKSMPGVNAAGHLMYSPQIRPQSPAGSPNRVRPHRKPMDEAFPSSPTRVSVHDPERKLSERSSSPNLGLGMPSAASMPRIRRPSSPLRHVAHTSTTSLPGITTTTPSPVATSPSYRPYDSLSGNYSFISGYPSSSVPSTPTSARSRSPSISSLETIPDSPDAEEAALEDERIAQLKAAADAAEGGEATGRGGVDVPTRGRTLGFGSRDKRKRWSVCGAERRQDLDLETIWED
ncbi:hypothetical protein B0H63DRAFT_444613 [Podospora didyma]|uniref:Basic proline-rich protein n=1 Tax=Podospora didyma TaxID=330526 RepID=A0AAE0P715_9PEZI|nr:hypothetical protein B0H63DRAFT_444613 [Podospora didyma]